MSLIKKKRAKHFIWLLLMFVTIPFLPGINFIFFGILWLIDIHKCNQFNNKIPEMETNLLLRQLVDQQTNK